MRTAGNLVVALAICAAAPATVPAQERAERASEVTVDCGSRDGRRTSCPADLAGYTFRDLASLGGSVCEAGRNWGYTDRGVWVDGGCRAAFRFERAAGSTAARGVDDPGRQRRAVEDERIVQCVSRGDRREQCRADLAGMRFAEVDETGRTPCEAGRNFGYDDRGMWVDEGCGGEFLFRSTDGRVAAFDRASADRASPYRDRAADDTASPARGLIVACESLRDDYTHCEAPGILSARLLRQVGRSECVQGSTWGVDERGIWVDRGCRADFEVFTRLSDSPPRPSRW